jgi:hypothetical protein
MSGRIIHCAQGSAEWFQARCGRATASEIVSVLSFLKRGDKKGGESEKRKGYKAELISEILTGQCDMTGYVSDYMQNGTDLEPFARAAYETRFDREVDQVGFIIHPTIERSGASPDGMIDTNGGLEIKAPAPKTHLLYLNAKTLPEDYEPQVMWNIACAEAEWWDFASFCPKYPRNIQLFTVRCYRNDARIAELDAAVRQFNEEIDAEIENLRREYGDFVIPAQMAAKTQSDDGTGITDDDIDWAMKNL